MSNERVIDCAVNGLTPHQWQCILALAQPVLVCAPCDNVISVDLSVCEFADLDDRTMAMFPTLQPRDLVVVVGKQVTLALVAVEGFGVVAMDSRTRLR